MAGAPGTKIGKDDKTMTEKEGAKTADVPPGRSAGDALYELSHLERTFTKGGVSVRPSAGWTSSSRPGRWSRWRTERVGQDHAIATARRPRQPDRRQDPLRGSRPGRAQRQGAHEDPRRGIGFVFQHFNLIPTLTGRGERAIAMFPNHVRSHERLERAKELLNQVGLGPDWAIFRRGCPVGEQQRVAIARRSQTARASSIADEPDRQPRLRYAKEVMATLNALRKSAGVTIVIATTTRTSHGSPTAASGSATGRSGRTLRVITTPSSCPLRGANTPGGYAGGYGGHCAPGLQR